MKLVLIILTLLSSLSAWTESSVGNGGKAVICNPPIGVEGPTEYFVLDYLMAKKEWGFEISSEEGEGAVEKALNLASRLESMDQDRLEKYLNDINQFMENAKFFIDYNLFMVDDSSQVGIPINCKLELVVNQRVPVYPEDKRYRINDNLWKKLSTDQKAGIILHEIILKEVVELGQSYSDNAIYFNAVISSTKMEHQNYDFYANTLTATHLPYRKMIDGQYFKFQGNEKYPLKIYSNGEVQQGIIDQDLWYDSHYLNFTFENTSFPQSLGSPIAFRPDGSLHKGSPLGEQYSLIELDRQGQTLSAVNLDYNNSFWINVKNIDVNTDRKYESWAFNFTPSKNGLNWGEEDKYVIRFYPRYYPQFKIKYGYFTKGHRGNKKRYLHTRENEKVEPAGPIYFDQDGYVIDN